MYGELSENNRHVNMPFEDVHRLVMTMRMAELVLNDRVQLARREEIARIKAKLNADFPDMPTLLLELNKAKQHALTQNDADAYDLEGWILFETMLITRAVDWLARLSIDPNAETQRGTIAVFSELQAAYSSQRTLHELYFYHHDDKKLLEARVRGATVEMGERLMKVAVGSVIQKRQNIAAELQSISTLVVEEMLKMANQSYSAALTASHMGHLAYEHTLTIMQLRAESSKR